MAPEVSHSVASAAGVFLILTNLVAFASVFLVGYGRGEIAKRSTLGSIRKPKGTDVAP